MPHGEFPSGSACLCSAASAITAQVYGKESDDSFPLDVTYNHNSVEPRLDNQNYQQSFANLKEYADDCALSRFRGGMHFKFSVEPGSLMCTGNDFFLKSTGLQQLLMDWE